MRAWVVGLAVLAAGCIEAEPADLLVLEQPPEDAALPPFRFDLYGQAMVEERPRPVDIRVYQEGRIVHFAAFDAEPGGGRELLQAYEVYGRISLDVLDDGELQQVGYLDPGDCAGDHGTATVFVGDPRLRYHGGGVEISVACGP